MRGFVDRLVTKAAIDPNVTNVVPVVKLDWLLDRILHSSSDGSTDVYQQCAETARHCRCCEDQAKTCQVIIFRAKQERHFAGRDIVLRRAENQGLFLTKFLRSFDRPLETRWKLP